MIRALGTQQNGRQILILGIDKTNVEKLTSGQPIFVGGKNKYGLDVPIDFVILYGETLDKVSEMLTACGICSIPNSLPEPMGKIDA
jgi:hypothetical protein